ncbi:MAG: flavin reductase family protein [Cyclobacteriaceae bacterium]
MIKTVLPSEVSTGELHQLMLGTISPRPIAFASTINEKGEVNLSPFSFFNVFSANPPILIFSPARRVRDNTTKHTYENVLQVKEVVVNLVDYSMVEQMSLASTEYDEGVNEFEKSGFTELPSKFVKPPRVKEAPASYECKVIEVKQLGTEGGAGNLIICEVLAVHVNERILDSAGKVDPFKLDSVARMGGNWYCRAQGSALFEVAKPISTKGIGFDEIPANIRKSKILTGNHLGKLGNVEELPLPSEIEKFSKEPEVSAILDGLDGDPDALHDELHKLATYYLDNNDILGAWKVLLQD